MSPPSRCTTCGRLLSWYDKHQRQMSAIAIDRHVVIERVTEAEAREACIEWFYKEQDSNTLTARDARAVWLAAYRALGAIKGE